MGWFILLRVMSSVSASALQKRLLVDGAPMGSIWTLTYALMLLPALGFLALRFDNIPHEFWWNIFLAGVIDSLGNIAMVAALKTMDLSIFGPLNGLRAIIALAFGWWFLGEFPSTLGVVGVVLTLVGTVVLISRHDAANEQKKGGVLRAMFLRLTGLSLGVLGAVYLKRAAGLASAEITVAGWIVSGLLTLIVVTTVLWPGDFRSTKRILKDHGNWVALHAGVFLFMQWLTIRIFQETLLAYSFVFFQLAMVLQVIAGKYFFSEQEFGRRMISAVVIGLGSILILWKG